MSKNRKIKEASAAPGDRRREVFGVLGLGATLFLLAAMLSLQAGRMVMGPFGKSSAGLFYGLAGVCSYVLVGLALVAAIRTLIERDPVMPATIALGAAIGVVSLATLAHLVAPGYRVAGHGPGGLVGEHLAEVLRAVISTAGTALLGCVGLVVAAVVATPLRMRDVLRAIGRAAAAAGAVVRSAVMAFVGFWADVLRAILPEKRGEFEDEEAEAVRDDDVLEVGDTDRVAEPQIIERALNVAT